MFIVGVRERGVVSFFFVAWGAFRFRFSGVSVCGCSGFLGLVDEVEVICRYCGCWGFRKCIFNFFLI